LAIKATREKQLGSELLNVEPWDEIGSRIYKKWHKITFWGGFAVDADFTDGFSGSIEDPKINKIREKSIKFMFFPGGGSGPKHSAFCGACFSINLYSSVFGQI
jgi:hypothetical protein